MNSVYPPKFGLTFLPRSGMGRNFHNPGARCLPHESTNKWLPRHLILKTLLNWLVLFEPICVES